MEHKSNVYAFAGAAKELLENVVFPIRNTESVCVTKAYVVAELSQKVDFAWIAANILAPFVDVPTRYCLNYGKETEFSSARFASLSRAVEDLESLLIIDSAGEVPFIIGSVFSSDEARATLEFVLVAKRTDDFTDGVEALRRISSKFKLAYGYCRTLRANFSPLSEAGIKKGVFGSTLSVEKASDAWLLDPHGITNGAIKGIYPVNFWQNNVLGKLSGIGLELPQASAGGADIIQFDNAMREEVLKKNPRFARYIHFGDT